MSNQQTEIFNEAQIENEEERLAELRRIDDKYECGLSYEQQRVMMGKETDEQKEFRRNSYKLPFEFIREQDNFIYNEIIK